MARIELSLQVAAPPSRCFDLARSVDAHVRSVAATGERMVRGVFARFDHDHYFQPIDGGTLLRDIFDYRAPLGPLGWLAERLFLSAYMQRFLHARMQELKVLAESDAWREFITPEPNERGSR